MFNYFNKRKYDNEPITAVKLVAAWLIGLLLLFRGDEYQGHVAQVEVIAM